MDKLLVANRGEIARRIIRTARAMNIPTVLVCSEIDTDTPAAREADETVIIGPPLVQQSYLNQDAVIQAALDSGATAIHPGFGFLSENADFAQKVIDAGLTWVGPSPDTIRLMGNKSEARRAAAAAGVPTLAGTEKPLSSPEEGLEIARTIGFPLLVKASAGGGGRGIRLVEKEEDLLSTIETAQAEAQASFGDPAVYLEKFITKARHIEVQVLGDGTNFIHLGDRDCTYQRRSQKVLEEAPAPNLSDEVREQIRTTSVELAKNAGYQGAGTVEFIFDIDRQEAAFIEMNTRIQVEHPVTEEITGIDIVEQQLRIADGQPLSITQEEVTFNGVAIECRINAEDPFNNFFPSPGTINTISWPTGDGVRIDSGVETGSEVSPYYDSMLAKIIVSAPSRDEATRNMQTALNELTVEGITVNTELHQVLLARPEFTAVEHHTKFIENTPELLTKG